MLHGGFLVPTMNQSEGCRRTGVPPGDEIGVADLGGGKPADRPESRHRCARTMNWRSIRSADAESGHTALPMTDECCSSRNRPIESFTEHPSKDLIDAPGLPEFRGPASTRWRFASGGTRRCDRHRRRSLPSSRVTSAIAVSPGRYCHGQTHDGGASWHDSDDSSHLFGWAASPAGQPEIDSPTRTVASGNGLTFLVDDELGCVQVTDSNGLTSACVSMHRKVNGVRVRTCGRQDDKVIAVRRVAQEPRRASRPARLVEPGPLEQRTVPRRWSTRWRVSDHV